MEEIKSDDIIKKANIIHNNDGTANVHIHGKVDNKEEIIIAIADKTKQKFINGTKNILTPNEDGEFKITIPIKDNSIDSSNLLISIKIPSMSYTIHKSLKDLLGGNLMDSKKELTKNDINAELILISSQINKLIKNKKLIISYQDAMEIIYLIPKINSLKENLKNENENTKLNLLLNEESSLIRLMMHYNINIEDKNALRKFEIWKEIVENKNTENAHELLDFEGGLRGTPDEVLKVILSSDIMFISLNTKNNINKQIPSLNGKTDKDTQSFIQYEFLSKVDAQNFLQNPRLYER